MVLNRKYSDLRKYDIDISYLEFLSLFKDVIFKEKKITVFIDDLDLGWTNRPHERTSISALLNVLRRITREVPNIKFRVALRSSVYFAVRSSDESTDKIESSVVWLKWNNHEILSMLVKRIIYFDKHISVDESELLRNNQLELSKNLRGIFEKTFKGRGQWENVPIHKVLLSLIRQRPRDLIKLCNMAAQEAITKGHSHVRTEDLQSIFQKYSLERMQDTINEYKSELNELQRILFEMKPESKKNISPFLYTPQDLIVKMKNVLDHVGKLRFSNGELVTPQKLAVFLYKINFFTARKDSNSQIIRFYYDENNYALNESIDFGFNVEVHPAYRWALQPQDIEDIYSSIELVE